MSEARGGHLSGAPALTRYALSRRAGSLLFLAGLSARQPDNSVKGASRGPTGAIEIDIRVRTEGCIENLRAALESEGLRLDDVADVTVFS
jgi:enamine deaminase RidA (YjgF/YER057c/UK114 family)